MYFYRISVNLHAYSRNLHVAVFRLSSILFHHRTAHCSESSEIVLAQQVVNDPYWPGEPILTTPNICLNEIFCGVIDSTNRSDYRVIYIDDIIGKLGFISPVQVYIINVYA